MAKQNSSGWLDQFVSKVPKTFGKGVVASDVAQSKPGPVFLGNPYAKEMAKRQTSISAYDAEQKASPAMQQVFTEKADTQAKKKRIRDILEKGQDVLGKAEMLSFIPTPFTEVIGGAAGITNAGISALLAGQDFSEGNYASALGNLGAGALGTGAGYTVTRGGLKNVIDDLLPAKGPKNFMTGQSMSNTPGTLGTVKPLEPYEEIGFHAFGENNMKYVSDRELKEAYEEAVDKLRTGSNYKPGIDPFLDHDMEKALALDVRMKFADRLPKFTDTNYEPSALQLNSPSFFDARGPYSERFFKQQGYDLSKLNPQERALMDAYQYGYDAYFNKRPSNITVSKNLNNYFDQLSDQFNTAVQKNKIAKDITLNRSVGNYTLDLLDPVTKKPIGRGLRDELSVGDVYKDEGFISTSLPHYLYGGNKYTDKIIVPGGGVQSYAFPNASSYGQFQTEQEVILPKGLIRRVEDVPEPGQIITSILNPYKNGGWLDKYNDGGPVQENYNDYSVSAGPGFRGDGYSNVGRNYSPAWGGQFAMGGSVPGSVGFTYARTIGPPAPSNGKYAKKTKASAQDGKTIYSGMLPEITVVGSKDPQTEEFYRTMLDRLSKEEGISRGIIPNDSSEYDIAFDDPISTNNILGRYQGLMDLGKKYGFPKVHPIDSNSIFAVAEKLSQDQLFDTPPANYNPLTKTIQGTSSEDWVSELAHHIQFKNNPISTGFKFLTSDVPAYISGKSPYQKPGAMEYEAHSIIEPKLEEEIKKSKSKYKQLPYIQKLTEQFYGPIESYQNGGEMRYYQEGLDFKPKTISKDGGWLSKYEEGGVIQDDMGQWNHPGEITEIGSNQITMQGVPYPVLGISNTGDTQMMYPNQEYQYDGSSVTEYPIMAQGGQLTKLDQLTNFTNYNTKQPGGWLDKYQ